MNAICTMETISQEDVINTIKTFEENYGSKNIETVIVFASELTGLSEDKITENL